MNEERPYANRDELAEHLAAAVADDLRAGIATRGAAVLLLSPRPSLVAFFARLRVQALDWARVSLVPTDDAWVAPNSPASGERLLRRHLMQDAVLDATLLSLWTGQDKPIAAVVEIGERLARLPRPFDAVVLAPGESGQIAALFDDTPALDAMLKPDWAVKVAPALAPAQVADVPREHLTLTLSALLDARCVYLAHAEEIPLAAGERTRSVQALLRQRRTPLRVLHSER